MAYRSTATIPDLALPLRRGCATALAGVHGSGFLADLDVFPGRNGNTPGAVIALVGIAALAALIRRHTGMEVGMALSLIAMVGLVVLVWVVFAFVALALVAGG